MAQAFARVYADGKVEAFSAGSAPSGKINPKAIAAMSELGYDLSKHESKSLKEIPEIEYDYIVTMGCGDSCPWVPAKNRIDWNIPDPRNMDRAEFNAVRDLIKVKVQDLLRNL